jgi:hypothetical protein
MGLRENDFIKQMITIPQSTVYLFNHKELFGTCSICDHIKRLITLSVITFSFHFSITLPIKTKNKNLEIC